jgi:hypothetical protein
MLSWQRSKFFFVHFRSSRISHVVQPGRGADDRLAVALPEMASERVPFARVLPSIIGSIGSLKRFVAIQANPYKVL